MKSQRKPNDLFDSPELVCGRPSSPDSDLPAGSLVLLPLTERNDQARSSSAFPQIRESNARENMALCHHQSG